MVQASARPGVGAQLGNYGYLPAAVSVVQSWSLDLRCFLWPKPHTGFHNRSKARLRNDYPQGKKFVLSSSIPSATLPSHQMSTISHSLIFFGRMHVPTRTLSIFELQRVWSLLLSVPFFHRGDLEDWYCRGTDQGHTELLERGAMGLESDLSWSHGCTIY